MQFKLITISLALAKIATVVSADVTASNYWESISTKIDPKNITLPSIKQTTSYDVDTQCTYYTPDSSLITFNESEWPTSWETATSNGMDESDEFLSLYNSIDWTKAPNINPRTLTSDGGLDTSSYSDSDPDCWWSASTCTTPKLSDVNADIYACPEPETWGLTYDDGPNCSHNAFYDYLSDNKLKATMFYIGSNVMDWPYGAMRGMRDGHHIASHTWSHNYTTILSNKEVLAELYYTQKAIKLTTGVTPKYWRPPYGDVDDRVRWIATQLNLTAVIWNLDTNDWAAGDTETVEDVQATYDDFITMGTNGTFATSGQIVLTHEIDNTTMQLAVDNLAKIQKAYKNVIDVATCYNISYPYFEDYQFTDVMNATTTTDSTANSADSDSASSTTISLKLAKAAASVNAGSASVPSFGLAIVLIAALVF
ncbi:hypothetical protein G6F46_007174 [Rhizopus delemar]|uniref:chitin deacetylase n=3 Tax=Rhizopus TaxID=4842 RepID=I1CDZ8_RHIO9|nr:hypothetical protein RO3G_11389 [Rhizopus delemar RA 99-880]KAG1058078.1 hypothetical protein G6F43_000113 [Rhizopus delemar]KAG1539478.1 hypothetical protein G6F51_009117 [Rhizopus arrhizus]KAG1453987.1 hypothetical protein G6F55_007843 [Rhizopus delemar]KAG1500847.1 hypothetical protein G6F54_003438 [Rhizopus delemar]|eukprot:EIE86678.1 hypothetical protein RO3G_11389 [Rhizopus delemar RA 99-880]